MSASQPKEPSSKSVSRSSMALAKRVTEAADRTGMLYFTTTSADGRVVSTPAGELVNFASCSYLGLETSAELVAGATSAMARYGVQLSSSRVYLQTDLYREAEELLGEIMGARVLVFPSTTLTHFGIMPALITPKDAVILDAYVHASVQACVRIVQASGTRVSHFPHSDLDALRAEVISLRADGVKGRIWVMVDGIYSMRGDTVPAAGLVALAEELDLTLYVDDAHGFSWTGASGRGWWLENAPATDCAIVVGSLSKSFAAAGGLAVFPDEASFSLARVLSGSLLFSGPLPPASLGALNASARLHLSSSLPALQGALAARIAFMESSLAAAEIEVLAHDGTPIFYAPVGEPERGAAILLRLADLGYFANLAVYPVVPVEATGIRFTVTNQQSLADIHGFVSAFETALRETA